jgi:DNA-binding NarL/FixJ family response regulator
VNVRILLVDDHRMAREGLRSILDMEEGLDVIGEAGSGREAREMARALHPDVILMDVGMKDLSGIEATRQIKAENPQARVVAVSTYSEEPYVLGMFEAGASAYVLKEAALVEMPRAVRAVAEGHHCTSPRIWGSAQT